MEDTLEMRALRQLMGAYLHQDFDLDGTVEDKVDLFVAGSPGLATQRPGEVAHVLDQSPSEEALALEASIRHVPRGAPVTCCEDG
jgi:hypothetical protein